MKQLCRLLLIVIVGLLSSSVVAGAERNMKQKGSGKSTDKVALASLIDPTTGMKFVKVPDGCFQMGDTFGGGFHQEKPAHEVCVSNFTIAVNEVTVREYLQFVKETGSHLPEWMAPGSEFHYHTGTDDRYRKLGTALTADSNPIVGVSWDDAVAFARWLSGKNGRSYRLPTEAEWEYACRSGGKKEKFCGGDNLDAVAWHIGNSGDTPHTVGQKQPNGLGLYDMSGNVWEWVNDWFGSYPNRRLQDPQGPTTGVYRLFRGGYWGYAANFLRASNRSYNLPDTRQNYLGFRLAFSNK